MFVEKCVFLNKLTKIKSTYYYMCFFFILLTKRIINNL